MEFVYPAQIVPWTEPRCGIKSLSADGLTLTMQDCLGALPPKPNPTSRWFMAGLPGCVRANRRPRMHSPAFDDVQCMGVRYSSHRSLL
jgi:hypothetical protein